VDLYYYGNPEQNQLDKPKCWVKFQETYRIIYARDAIESKYAPRPRVQIWDKEKFEKLDSDNPKTDEKAPNLYELTFMRAARLKR